MQLCIWRTHYVLI